MSQTDLSAAVERLMGRVDFYLHCELDQEYERPDPVDARQLLELAIRSELQRAGAVGLLSASAPFAEVIAGHRKQVA